jgi:hypothetical protein
LSLLKKTFARLITFIFIAQFLIACGNSQAMIVPTPFPTPLPTHLKSPEYGIQAFLWWKPEITKRDLTLVQQMGFTWVKQNIAWRDIEITKGEYSWSLADDVVRRVGRREGIKLLVRLDRQPFWSQASKATPLDNAPPKNLDNFRSFCHAIADRFKGKIAAYEVWNEPNLSREWGNQPPDPKEYVELLKACYIGIKSADPNAIVISAGMAPTGTSDQTAMPDDQFIDQMYQAGAANYFDILGVNAPGYKAPPEISPAEVAARSDLGGQRFFAFRHVEDIRAIMQKYHDDQKQIAIMEFGWTTDSIHPEYAWHAVTEQEQADYMVRAYQYAYAHWSPWISIMSAITLPDPFWTPDDEQYWWAITYPDWPENKVRPAYDALKAMPKLQK